MQEAREALQTLHAEFFVPQNRVAVGVIGSVQFTTEFVQQLQLRHLKIEVRG